MKVLDLALHATCVALFLFAFSAAGADYPAPKEGDWLARNLRFHTGEVMPELRLLYTTVGQPSGQPASDGLRTKFARYNYDDMVMAQYRLVFEGLGVRHLRLVMGVSMGGMRA